MLGSEAPFHVLGLQGSGGILPCSPDNTAAPTSGTTKTPAKASSMPDHRQPGELQQILPSRHYPLHHPLRSSFGSDNPRPVLYNLATVLHGLTSTSRLGRFFWSADLGQDSVQAHVALRDHYYGHQVTSSLQAQTASLSTPQMYQQPGFHGFHGYSAGNMPAVGGAAAQTTPDWMGGYPGAAGLDEAYASYQSTLEEIFRNIRGGVLVSASDSLLDASRWLLSHVVELGMSLP